MATAMIWVGFRVGRPGGSRNHPPDPAGLSPGQSFRFAFVTDGTTDATSTNMCNLQTVCECPAEGPLTTARWISWLAIASTQLLTL